MSTFIGKNGVLRIGANAIAEIVDFEIEESVDLVEDTALADKSKTYKSADDLVRGWTGKLTAHWDDTDTNGQEAAVIAALIAIEAYPEGTAVGASKLSGSAVVDNVAIGVAPNAIVSRTITFTGTGDLTIGTA